MRRLLSLALALVLVIAPSAIAGPNKITLRPPEDAMIDLVPDPTGGFLITITAPQPTPPAVQPTQQPSSPAQPEPPAIQPTAEPQPQPPTAVRLSGQVISPGGRTALLIFVTRPGKRPQLVDTVPIDDAGVALARWRSRLEGGR